MMVMAGQQSECKYAKETVHLKMFKMVNLGYVYLPQKLTNM